VNQVEEVRASAVATEIVRIMVSVAIARSELARLDFSTYGLPY
jgi:hypothetical protein